MLERIEGHLIRGYGDSQKPDVDIELLPEAIPQADAFLEELPDSQERLTRVAELIEGFEIPYGMELLSSVDWVARHASCRATDPESAICGVHAWNARKGSMFNPAHIRAAWQRLAAQGRLPVSD